MALINVAMSKEMKSALSECFFGCQHVALYVVIVPLIIIVVAIESEFYFILQQNEEVWDIRRWSWRIIEKLT